MAKRGKIPAIAAASCRKIHRLIVERFDRPLSADEENQVDLHIATCPDCLAFYRQLALIRKAFETFGAGAVIWEPAERRRRR